MKHFEIMIVEDNSSMRLGMAESLRREGFTIHEFDNGNDALTFFEKRPVSLVLADLKMEPVNGIEILKRTKALQASTEVIMVSAFGTVETAVEAMQLGAADFLTKPFSADELRIRVKKIIEKIQQSSDLADLKEENKILHDELFSHYEEILGHSPAMYQIFEIIERIAKEDTTVLIEGESGTGKELVARAIHRQSARHGASFIKVNCGALNDNLLESELFGHEKGAFTGAIRRKKGRFELADGGTLFLDEIGDISPAMQVRLLHVIQDKTFERVGGEETISSDVRIISATHRNLSKWIAEEKFREDLYYRLRVIPIRLPPLRERKEDIPLLVEHFLKKFGERRKEEPKSLSPEGLEILRHYSWPGNIRELENLFERLCVITPGPHIDLRLMAQHLVEPRKNVLDPSEQLPLEASVVAFERKLIEDALKKTGGIKNQAAKILGIRTSTLYYKMERLGLLAEKS